MENITAIQDITRAKVDDSSDDGLEYCGNKALNNPESIHHTSSPYSKRFFTIQGKKIHVYMGRGISEIITQSEKKEAIQP